jgi:hypothetical protein
VLSVLFLTTYPETMPPRIPVFSQSNLPNGVFVPAHSADLLRQVEGVGVPKGGWVGGGSWFGTVLSTVQIKVRFGLHSTWEMR